MKVGKISNLLGSYCLSVTISTQNENGYWEAYYKKKNFASDDLTKLRKIKVGMQYFGDYWGSLVQ